MTIGVFGSTGAIGSRVKRRLAERGAEGRALVRVSEKADLPIGVIAVHGDLDDLRSIRSALAGAAQWSRVAGGVRSKRPDLRLCAAPDDAARQVDGDPAQADAVPAIGIGGIIELARPHMIPFSTLYENPVLTMPLGGSRHHVVANFGARFPARKPGKL